MPKMQPTYSALPNRDATISMTASLSTMARKYSCRAPYNWCVLLDKASKQVLFHALDCANAHSAELLPGNRIAVACSDGTTSNHNQVRLYDAARSNVLLDSSPLTSAHGVTWCESTQRLYAVGNRQINVYSLQDWDTSAPKLKLEKSITTPQGKQPRHKPLPTRPHW